MKNLLLVVFFGMMAAGCGGSGEPIEPTNPAPPPGEPEAAGAAEGKTKTLGQK